MTVKNGEYMTKIDQKPNDTMYFANFDTNFDDALLEAPLICK